MADDKMFKPGMAVPQDVDGASVTRSPKKGEKPTYEEPGTGILVDGKPLVTPKSPPKSPPKVEKKAKGGSISSASSRADGCAERGKTKGTIVMCGGGMAK